jgi:hypothetical protein
MPKCKNDSTKSYKGDEPSPKGLGICAHAEKTGLIMNGLDGNQWIVKEDKNKIKRWYKYTKKSSTKNKINNQFTKEMFFGFSPMIPKDFNKLKSENIIKIIIDKLIPNITKNEIEAYLVPLPISSNGIYWSDYPPDYIKEYYNSSLKEEYLYFIVYLNDDKTINYNRNIAINYYIEPSNLEKIQNIFYNELPNHFIWKGNIHSIMEISYQPIKNNTKSKIDISSDYPNFYVSIKLNLKKNEPDLLNLVINFNDINEFKLLKSKFNDLEWGMDDISFIFHGIKDFKKFEKTMKNIIKNKKITISKNEYDIKKINISGYLNETDAKDYKEYKIK